MAITRSIEFYCGKKNVRKLDFFGNYFNDYEFTYDIAYKDISFSTAVAKLREYMIKHDIKIGYCDIATDFGGGYSLNKRYTFVNKNGTFITERQKYDY